MRVLLLLTVSVLLGGSVPISQPSDLVLPFEDEGACPFECCTYRSWTVEADTRILTERSDEAALAFMVERGDRVEGLTGVVVTVAAGRAVVRRSTTVGRGDLAVAPGDDLYVLRYVGEGYWKFWLRGTIDTEQIPWANARCVEGGEAVACAVQITEEPRTEWWARIRDRIGREGWTRELDRFGGIDACA